MRNAEISVQSSRLVASFLVLLAIVAVSHIAAAEQAFATSCASRPVSAGMSVQSIDV